VRDGSVAYLYEYEDRAAAHGLRDVVLVERLEGLVAKLPEKIRRPVLRELTPLKELFLQQRPPRFLFVGSSKMPAQQIINEEIEQQRRQYTSLPYTLPHCHPRRHIALINHVATPNVGVQLLHDA